MSSREERKREACARRKRDAELRARARRKRRLVGIGATAVTVVVLAGAIAIAVAEGGRTRPPSAGLPARDVRPASILGTLGSPGSPGRLGPEGVPVPQAPNLAGAGTAESVSITDGIQCVGAEQLLFHIHAHLTVFVNGRARRIPYGVGVRGAQVTATPAGPFAAGGSCFYWLHTHAADGIIHIESPIARTFTLGDFFDVWRQKLGPDEVGPSTGPVTSLVDGYVYRGNPRDIPLAAHAQIQLEVGRQLVAPVAITFAAGL